MRESSTVLAAFSFSRYRLALYSLLVRQEALALETRQRVRTNVNFDPKAKALSLSRSAVLTDAK